MGMPLPSLHSPSIASSNDATPSTSSIQDLIRQKDNLESELRALGSVLDSHGVNMRTTLTSFDGYPRADIDIAQVRTTRARIIHLRNDHKAIMERIEKALHEHFAASEAQEKEERSKPATITSSSTPQTSTGQNSTAASTTTTHGTAQTQTQPAFAIVNTVTANSPAETAGLRAGDSVLSFGDANWRNHEKLARVAQIVGRSEGRRIEVVVARDQAVLTLGLVPRRDWGGRGTLGCHLKEA